MSIIKFTGIFDKYTPVNSEPHYVFKTENKYIIKCQDHPDLISEVSPEDLVNIQGEILEQYPEGIKLVNVRFGGDVE